MSVFGAIGGLIEVGGAIVGELIAAEDDAEKERILHEAIRRYGNTILPQIQQLAPEVLQGTSLEGVASDYGNKGNRNAAIEALMREGLSGGDTLENKLAQAQAQKVAGQASRQATQNALASAASRGMSGSAATLQAQLLGNSTAADRAADIGLQGAYNARKNALAALQAGGAMAMEAEGQDTQKDMAIRSAKDRINQFNAQQRTDAARYNNQIAQQRWENTLENADRDMYAGQMKAGIFGDRANRKRRTATGIGKGLGKAVGSLGDFGGGEGGMGGFF